MSYQPEIVPNSPTGQALQAAIQRQLALQGWSTEDDAVMAEYCLVMLGNKKTPDQISSELSDLIGGDFDASFVTWLFAELAHHYPDPSASASAGPSSSPVQADSNGPRFASRQPPSNQRSQDNRRAPPGPANMFGAALSGVKRDARDLDAGPQAQRARYDRPPGGGFDGVPSGPRGQQQNGTGVRGAAGRNGRADDRSLLDRVGAPPAGPPAPPQFGPPAGFDPSRNGMPFPPFGMNGMNPQAAMQAQAMAMAQAFAAMQGWTGPPGGPQQFNPNGPQFFPPGFNPQQQQQQRGGPPQQRGNGPQNQRQQPAPFGQRPSGPPKTNASASTTIPTKPVEEAICKHGVDCTKPTCPFSHPSPAATKETGLVLSSEACEKQLACEDPDCSKSHVSVAQKKSPGSAAPITPAPTSVPASAPVSNPAEIPGAGERTCKFAGACTRPGCVFLHPWDVKGDPGNTSGVACRWGENCTRPDCHFSHPPGRHVFHKGGPPKYHKAGPPYTAKSYSATFNNPKNPAIGAWPAEKATHVSDRLKRFNLDGAEENGKEGERIIPGGGDDAKVEISLESPEAQKVEEEPVVSTEVKTEAAEPTKA